MINLLVMIFMHILDDYYLQGILASMKQKNWWEKNNPQKKYKYDYLMALFMHAFSWSFMIMIPSMIQHKFVLWVFIANLLIHFVVDHLKANLQKINLITDQTIHLIQIILTYLICF
jgi:hypothetical protein